MTSICPRCASPLAGAACEGMRVETCEGCGGFWLGRNPFADLLSPVESPQEDRLSWRPLRWEREGIALACPDCGGSMEAFEDAPRDVILDHCPRCQRIWMDGREVTKLQQTAPSLVPARVPGRSEPILDGLVHRYLGG